MEKEKIFEGKTVDHAVEEACKYFSCSKDDLEIEIITKGSTGIFGIGGRKAQITVRPKAHTVVKAEEAPIADRQTSEQEDASSKTEVKVETKDEVEPFLGEACEILQEILTRSGIVANVEAHMNTIGGPYLNILGDDISLVIGRGGQNLMAFKHIVNIIMKRRHAGCPTIELDAQGYVEKRRAQLEDTARRLAEKARRMGKSISMDPMDAKERRIVHLAVKKISGVTTKSIGEGGGRRVLIVPQRKRPGHRQGSFNRNHKRNQQG